MNQHSCSRRAFLRQSAGACAAASGTLLSVPIWSVAKEPEHEDVAGLISRIKDPEIRAGVKVAVEKNILPACVENAYTGYFYITADGGAYGSGMTWPGLDSWQMAGALLLVGQKRIVEDYVDYVRASQRKDGNIPLAIFPEQKPNNTCLRGLKWPDDVFSYTPPKREGVPASGQQTRKWIGMFEHWQNMGDPLSTLGPVCYILTAAEIFGAINSLQWLNERSASIERAGQYLLSRKSKNGLISGSGFYSEQPPRVEWDGVTQCYVVHAFRELARLLDATGKKSTAAKWNGEADAVTKSFSKEFWRTDHFGEYLHPEHGLLDSHGLSDTNWAAVAFGLATDEQLKKLWPRLLAAKEFWFAEMPTQSVTKPFAYEPWEQNFGPPCPVPPLNDVAAMGRVWYLEAMACQRMKANERLVESARKVCKAAKDGYWRERYHPQKDGKVTADGAQKYCEYPAVLVRIVLGNPDVFST